MGNHLAAVPIVIAVFLVGTVTIPGLSIFSDPNPAVTGEKETIQGGKTDSAASDSTGEVAIKGGGLPPGCVCHSNNPAFVKMHNLFSVEDCRKCHGEDERLMGRTGGEMTELRKAALEERRRRGGDLPDLPSRR